MNWLRRLLSPTVEEVVAAPPAPSTATPPVPDKYVAYRQAAFWTCTCAGCGKVETHEGGLYSHSTPKGWGNAHTKVGLVLACTDCVGDLRKAEADYAAEAARVREANYATQNPVTPLMRAWEAANPQPRWGHYPSKEVFARRTTCGKCGAVVDVEAPLHAMPQRPEGWQRESGGANGHGAIVCPSCFEAAAPLRQVWAEWLAQRNETVGNAYRKVVTLPPPTLKLPSTWKVKLPSTWKV